MTTKSFSRFEFISHRTSLIGATIALNLRGRYPRELRGKGHSISISFNYLKYSIHEGDGDAGAGDGSGFKNDRWSEFGGGGRLNDAETVALRATSFSLYLVASGDFQYTYTYHICNTHLEVCESRTHISRDICHVQHRAWLK